MLSLPPVALPVADAVLMVLDTVEFGLLGD